MWRIPERNSFILHFVFPSSSYQVLNKHSTPAVCEHSPSTGQWRRKEEGLCAPGCLLLPLRCISDTLHCFLFSSPHSALRQTRSIYIAAYMPFPNWENIELMELLWFTVAKNSTDTIGCNSSTSEQHTKKLFFYWQLPKKSILNHTWLFAGDLHVEIIWSWSFC